MEKSYEDINKEICDIYRKLSEDGNSFKGSDIYKLYRDYLKLCMMTSTNHPNFDYDKDLYPYGNCYCYALGFRCPSIFAKHFNEKCLIFFPYNIGLMHSFFTNHKTYVGDLESDLDTLGVKYFETDYDMPNEHGGYKISLYESSDDFHFIRQNEDGTWSHKLGFSDLVERIDNPSKYLFDEYECIKTLEIVKPVLRKKV